MQDLWLILSLFFVWMECFLTYFRSVTPLKIAQISPQEKIHVGVFLQTFTENFRDDSLPEPQA